MDRLFVHNDNINSNISQFFAINMLINNWDSTGHKMNEQQSHKLKHIQRGNRIRNVTKTEHEK
jgi:hypothetical protein